MTHALHETDARAVLLVRSVEEADPAGILLAADERAGASRRTSGRAGDETEAAAFVVARARDLADRLAAAWPALERVRSLLEPGLAVPAAVVAGSLLVGLATDALGAGRRVNLLSPPLLGVVAWNLAVYVGLAVFFLARPLIGERSGAGTAPFPARLLLGVVVHRARAAARLAGQDPDRTAAIGRALRSFADHWRRHAGALLAARLRRTMYLAAAALAVGVVAGMYLRGLAFEFEATWESTWLGPAAVQRLLDVLLAPASAVSGIAVPEVAPLRSPGGGDAAPWIHLFAWTVGLLVVLPRLSLAAVHAWRIVRLRSRVLVDLDEPYFRRLLAARSGAGRSVRLVPYSFRPSAAATERVVLLLHEFFGARADVRVREPLAYGDEPESLGGEGASCTALWFNLAQSPEVEVHGELLQGVKDRLPAGVELLVLIEASTYVDVASAERIEERLGAWRRVVREAGLEPAPVGLGTGADLELQAVRRALRPAPAATEGGRP